MNKNIKAHITQIVYLNEWAVNRLTNTRWRPLASQNRKLSHTAHNTHHHRINKNNLQSNLSLARFNTHLRLVWCLRLFSKKKGAKHYKIKLKRAEKELNNIESVVRRCDAIQRTVQCCQFANLVMELCF